jgi:hypothetical protein
MQVAYEHTAFFYDQNEDDNYRVYYPSIGLTYESGTNTSISVFGGRIWIDRETGDDEGGLFFSSDIAQTWPFRRGSLGITGSSGYSESYFDEDNLGLSIYYQGGALLSYEVVQNLVTTISGSYRITNYLNTEDDREDYTTASSVGLTYNGLRHVSANLSYDYRSVDSSEEDEGYQENRVSLSITFTPEQPMRILR